MCDATADDRGPRRAAKTARPRRAAKLSKGNQYLYEVHAHVITQRIREFIPRQLTSNVAYSLPRSRSGHADDTCRGHDAMITRALRCYVETMVKVSWLRLVPRCSRVCPSRKKAMPRYRCPGIEAVCRCPTFSRVEKLLYVDGHSMGTHRRLLVLLVLLAFILLFFRRTTPAQQNVQRSGPSAINIYPGVKYTTESRVFHGEEKMKQQP